MRLLDEGKVAADQHQRIRANAAFAADKLGLVAAS
jgi:hypothetical protein